MSDFGRLLKYEYLKVFRRKIVWVMLAVMVVLGIVSVYISTIGEEVAPSGVLAEIRQKKQEGMAISGKKIDEALLESYPSAEELPDSLHYTMSMAGTFDSADDLEQEPLAEKFYKSREKRMSEDNERYLTEGERQYWAKEEESLSKPFVFEYNEAGKVIAAMFYTMMILQILFTAASVPAIFSDEHMRKMSQINFGCKNGGKKLYLAKITVGFTMNVGAFLFTFLTWALTALVLFGFHGMGACVQLIYPNCSHHLTIGQFLGIQLGVALAMTVLCSAATMFFAEVLRSGVATMAILLGGMLLSGMFNIPEQTFRVLGQIWDSFSINFVAVWGILDSRLVPIAGKYFMQYQIVPVVWLALSALLTILGYLRYRRYQVTK